MLAKVFTYRGYTLEELQKIEEEKGLEALAELFPARQRRKIKRGLTEEERTFLKKAKKRWEQGKIPKTHVRDMIILPSMVGKKIAVHNGKEFVYVEIKPEMIGHYLGEYALTRKEVKHSGPGIGATRSTKFVSAK